MTKSNLAENLKYIYQPQAVSVYALILKWPFSIVIQLRIEMEKSESLKKVWSLTLKLNRYHLTTNVKFQFAT